MERFYRPVFSAKKTIYVDLRLEEMPYVVAMVAVFWRKM